MKTLLMFGVVLVTLTFAGCAHRHSDDRYYEQGPPPHAPAHGYRAKHHHRDMVYDSRIGAYVVLGYDDYYYFDDHYYRYRDGGWWFSLDLDGRDWHHADYDRVPHKLRKSKGGNGHKRQHKEHPGKGRDKGRDRY